MSAKVYKLNENQISEVNEAMAQYNRGEYLTDEEADKELDEWLKEESSGQ